MNQVNDEVSFEQQVSAAPAVLVDFGSQWCPPCKRLEEVIAAMQGAPASALHGLPVIKVDVDQIPALQRRFSVRALPTLVLFKQGKPVKSRVGATTAASLSGWLRDALEG